MIGQVATMGGATGSAAEVDPGAVFGELVDYSADLTARAEEFDLAHHQLRAAYAALAAVWSGPMAEAVLAAADRWAEQVQDAAEVLRAAAADSLETARTLDTRALETARDIDAGWELAENPAVDQAAEDQADTAPAPVLELAGEL